MTMDYNTPQAPPGPLVELDGVSLEPRPAYDVGLDAVRLQVSPGDLVLIRLERGLWEHPLADVISGLEPADAGTVRVFGRTWAERGPDEQARTRWRLGRVFAEHGWLSNLDVDENVTLGERHHSSRSLADIEAEADRLARLVGLDGLPQGRPPSVDEAQRRMAEWVRAALGTPWLALLERPGRDLGGDWIARLLPLVERLRGAGSGVVWFCEDREEWGDARLNPTLKLRAVGNTLQAEGSK